MHKTSPQWISNTPSELNSWDKLTWDFHIGKLILKLKKNSDMLTTFAKKYCILRNYTAT